ncbi:MAG: hypothetical protein WCL23_00720 [Candidatus Moraniibacteriota bacterium]
MNLIPVAKASGVIDDAPPLQLVGMRALELVLSLFGLVALVALIAAGVMYMMAGGDEEQSKSAKRMLGYSILGLSVVLLMLIAIRQLAAMV